VLMRKTHHAPASAPQSLDWLLFVIIIVMGGSSFAMIRSAVETIPPAVITVGRLWIGAIFLYLIMKQAGRKFPPLLDRSAGGFSIHLEWRWMIAIPLVGYVGPFFIFPWAQQYVDSGLAGIYMAFMPIWTVVLAYFFAGESLGPNKIIGFLLGFLGVIILMGPDVIGDAADTSLLAQAALLVATICYATYAVMTRRAPPIRPRIFAAGTLLVAAMVTTPALFFTDLKMDQWTMTGIINVIGLGLGPTGLIGILLIILIQRMGAGFMALANYITPLWAVALGAIIFHERLELTAFIALAVILMGVAISQRQQSGKNTGAHQTKI